MSKSLKALHLVFMMRFEMIDSKSGEKAQQRLAEGMTNVRVCEEILTGCCGR